MALLNKAVDGDFEMDEYAEEHLANKAHQIIYKRIHEKFKELLTRRDTFNDEIENTYKSALEKYSHSQAEPAVDPTIGENAS